jgi:two-component system CheB/CheR fusion protein
MKTTKSPSHNPKKKSTAGLPETKKIAQTNKNLNFPIVGIGASAGGLEALEQFFGNTPENTNMAFVIIQHLDPNRESITAQLIQRITPMVVLQATDRIKVLPNHVYIIPPNKSLSILHGFLHLFEPAEPHGMRLPVDIFFRSLANDRKDKSIGIILSGMGSDGSIGIKAIKEVNGIVMVQDPDSAKFDSMPRNAIDSVIVDIIAPAWKLPEQLITVMKFVPLSKSFPETDKVKSGIEKIIILLREHTGHDFSQYKKTTLFRRIERRKGIHQIAKIQDYVRFLQENPKEVEILFRELLIGVTNFFRDAEVWKKIKEVILPDIIKDLPDGYQIRAWIPGCSTGEEAYSLAIVFKEVSDKIKRNKNISLQIFATDLDTFAIDKARKGVYSQNIENEVSKDRIDRFFVADPEGYHISPLIREMIIFAPQSIIKDPPFTKLDILSCRNMLIYMEPELQKKILALFNYSLNTNGVLILGIAETIGNQNDKFRDLDSKNRIFKRSDVAISADLLEFPTSFNYTRKLIKKKDPVIEVENIGKSIEQRLLDRFIPASVLVNKEGDILYITGNIGKYLELVAGKANWNIYTMAREGFRELLPAAFRKALQSYEPFVMHNVKLKSDGGIFVDVTMQSIEKPEIIRGLVLLVFIDAAVQEEKEKWSGDHKSPKKQRQLEEELRHAHEELQSTHEEMQTSQEELRSINEELQSSNEEIQSANEELTTSKEEMQSLNEELQTVNAELQSKVNDLMRMNDDMKNLLNSTEIATLFVDRELNIRRYTDLVGKIIKLRETDIGRPFTELVTELQYPDIAENARQVLRTLIPFEKPITTSTGKWFNVRIMPYRTVDDHIDGLVITFIDTSEANHMEIQLKSALEELRKYKKT